MKAGIFKISCKAAFTKEVFPRFGRLVKDVSNYF
jgi:hypothetical protein